MVENISNLGRDLDNAIYENDRFPNFTLNRFSIRHIIIKLSKIKDKERILNEVTEFFFTYKDVSGFLSRNLAG